MPEFSYTVITQDGKTKKGHIEAKNKEVAVANLKADHNTVTSITEAGGLLKKVNLSFGQRIKARDLAVFCHQFVSIIGAGVTIVGAFQMLGDQTENPSLAEAIKASYAKNAN